MPMNPEEMDGLYAVIARLGLTIRKFENQINEMAIRIADLNQKIDQLEDDARFSDVASPSVDQPPVAAVSPDPVSLVT